MLQSQSCSLDLGCRGSSTQLTRQLITLRQSGRAERVPLRQQAAGWIGDDLAAVGVIAIVLFLARQAIESGAADCVLALGVYGASPISEAVLGRAIASLPNVHFTQAYGMTELSPIATLLHWKEHVGEGRAKGRHRAAGRATLGCEVRIVDADDKPVPHGIVGEIVVRGDNVMMGYWERPEEIARAVIDGWMHTGDGGYMDEDGFVFVVDRVKDMIISGGENVYSVEVENAVTQHPAVAQCAVIGIPNERWGEQVHAVVVTKSGAKVSADELIEFCKTLIAGYKCPRSVEISENALPLYFTRFFVSVGQLAEREGYQLII